MLKRTPIIRDTFLLLLIGTWVFHCVYPAFYSLYALQLKCAQQQKAINDVRGAAVETMQLTEASYQKYVRDGGKELSINGDLFDVVCTTKTPAGTVTCKIVKDRQETKLVTGYNRTHNKTDKEKLIHGLSYWWVMHQASALVAPVRDCKVYSRSAHILFLHSVILLNGYKHLPDRPPQVVV